MQSNISQRRRERERERDIHTETCREILVREGERERKRERESESCLLYTSDAADDLNSVDLGGRRIIKKIFFQAEDGIRD